MSHFEGHAEAIAGFLAARIFLRSRETCREQEKQAGSGWA